jgi:hypothetical protein
MSIHTNMIDTLRIPRKKEDMGLFRCYSCGRTIMAKKVLFATLLGGNKILYNYHGAEGMTCFVKHGVKIQCCCCYRGCQHRDKKNQEERIF